MNKKPLVSVICTVKNGENTILETLKSVQSQSYSNWEMIIVDDGSTDKTIDILKEVSMKCNKIKYFISGGIGRGKALNKAVEISNGKYITILDADDAIHPEKICIQIDVFKNNKVNLVSTENMFIYDNESPNWDDVSTSKYNLSTIDGKILKKNIINHSSVMMNKEWFLSIGEYNSERKSQLDYELWLRAYEKNTSMFKINERLTAKRIHSNQSFENKKRFKYLYNSASLQLKYNMKLRKNYYLIIIFPIRMMLGMLPFEKRLKIKRIFKLN